MASEPPVYPNIPISYFLLFICSLADIEEGEELFHIPKPLQRLHSFAADEAKEINELVNDEELDKHNSLVLRCMIEYIPLIVNSFATHDQLDMQEVINHGGNHILQY